jgi:ADP-heptose:LPS heptosyltransferase
VRALRNRYPESRLVLLAKPESAAFVRRLELADSTIEIDKHAFDRARGLLRPKNLLALLKLTRRLRAERAGTVVLFGHLASALGALKYALLAFATGARHRVGLDNGRGWFLTEAARDEGFGVRHETEYWMEVVALLGARGPAVLEAAVSDVDRKRASLLLAPLLEESSGPVVAVHPSTGWYGPGRKWDPERFARAIELLERSHPVRCVALGSADDRPEVDRMLSAMGTPALDLTGRTSVGELAAVLEKCDVLIANDGGVGHLAAAVGTPVVSVFGPSNDRAWRPLGSTVVAADLPCRPCFYRGFETGLRNGCGTRQCMELVTPDQVAWAAENLLAGAHASVV